MTQDLNLKGKYFVASRGFYGTNSVSYKNIEIEVTRYNHDYTNPVTSFDWGNTQKGSQLLAYAILDTIATPTIARVYATKYMQHVIEKFKEDEWRMEATEVAQWINNYTDYKIPINLEYKQNTTPQVIQTKEEKLNNTIKNSTTIIDGFCQDLQIQKETLAKILDISIEMIHSWQQNNEIPKFALKAMEFYKAGRMLKEQNTRLKIDIKQFQEDLLQNQTQISLYQAERTKYKKFINTLDMPNLYQKYKEL